MTGDNIQYVNPNQDYISHHSKESLAAMHIAHTLAIGYINNDIRAILHILPQKSQRSKNKINKSIDDFLTNIKTANIKDNGIAILIPSLVKDATKDLENLWYTKAQKNGIYSINEQDLDYERGHNIIHEKGIVLHPNRINILSFHGPRMTGRYETTKKKLLKEYNQRLHSA